MTWRVVVLGGGISGLAAAYELRKAVRSPSDLALTLVDAHRELGGTIATERQGGFLVERGPDSFLTLRPRALRLAEELELAGQVRGQWKRGVYGVRHGVLVPAPEGLVLLVPARLGPLFRTRLLSVPGKVRASLDLVVPARRADGDESLASFVRRRLGREVLARIADPMVAGIHAGDPERLSMESLLPQFLAYEQSHGSVIRGLWASTHHPASPPSDVPRPFATFRDGMGELPRALVQRTPEVEWRTGVQAVGVDRARNGRFQLGLSDGGTVTADAVIMTVPAFRAGELLRPLAPGLAAALGTIAYSSSAVVSLGFPDDASRPLDGSGAVVPRGEGVRLSACTFSSSKFEGRAPAGHRLVRAFYGGARDEAVLDRPDADLVDLALQELGHLLDLRGPTELVRVHRWPRAHAQYEVGHRARVAAIETAVADVPGLFLAGSAYHGVGIPDCITDADRAVQGTLAFLRGERPTTGQAAA